MAMQCIQSVSNTRQGPTMRLTPKHIPRKDEKTYDFAFASTTPNQCSCAQGLSVGLSHSPFPRHTAIRQYLTPQMQPVRDHISSALSPVTHSGSTVIPGQACTWNCSSPAASSYERRLGESSVELSSSDSEVRPEMWVSYSVTSLTSPCLLCGQKPTSSTIFLMCTE